MARTEAIRQKQYNGAEIRPILAAIEAVSALR